MLCAESAEGLAGGRESAEIVARASSYYRNTRYLMVLMFLGFGIACIWDGFSKYPKDNLEAFAKAMKLSEAERAGLTTRQIIQRAEKSGVVLPHPAYDIPLNQALGVLLPPLALATLLWALYNSRGSYRLAANTLYVPGHPPVSLDAIVRLDKRKWDKKGIAYIDYELPGPAGRGRFKLDDFVYQRDPIDRIFSRIEAHARLLTADASPHVE